VTEFKADVIEGYGRVTTATLTTVLLKHGVRNTWVRGAAPVAGPNTRVVGPAFTMRFIPIREDLQSPAAWSSPKSSRHAVEAVPEGAVVMIGADGRADAGVLGDILVERLNQRGAAGLVTDGAVRDLQGISETGLPVWAAGAAAPPAVASLHFAGWQEPIGCGGVPIFPGELIVADRDGAVVVPGDLVEKILDQCLAQEDLEEWVIAEVRKGEALPGLYPPNDKALERYKKARS